MSPAPPTRISDYLVLPVKFPATAIVPEATHYLYLRRHEPKLPGPDDARSLFAVNVPIDATAAHFRALFTSIGGGRVDDVVFENTANAVATVTKKRKRDGGGKEVRVWDRETRRSGSTAVIAFVDKASREVTLKAVAKRAAGRKKSVGVVWGEGIGESVKVPALGISRT
jgi:ribosomal RNA-processing protein 7